jgi:hypothetical protein
VAAEDPNLVRFREHALHAHMAQLRETLLRAMDVTQDDTASAILARLARGIENAERRLATADQALTSNQALKEMQRAAAEVNQHLTTWLNEQGNQAHLANAGTSLETSLLPAAYRLPQIETPADVAALFEAVEVARANAAKVLDDQRTQFTTLIESLASQLKAASANAEAVERDHARIKEAQANQDERITASVKRIDELVAEFNNRAAGAERDRDKRAAEAIDALRVEIAKRQEDSGREIQQLRENFERDTRQVLEALRRDKEEARNLLQAIGEIGVSSPFGNTAHGDRRAALLLRTLAGVFFTGMVTTVVAVTIWSFTNGPAQIDDMIFRFMTALIFAIPAYYFAREASKFQGEADRNRRLQLELASLGPYLENISDPSKRAAVREKLIERYFLGPNGSTSEPDKTYASMDVNALIEVLKEAVKRK